jgi:hypothetical protein
MSKHPRYSRESFALAEHYSADLSGVLRSRWASASSCCIRSPTGVRLNDDLAERHLGLKAQ